MEVTPPIHGLRDRFTEPELCAWGMVGNLTSEFPVIREELGSSRAEPASTSAMPTSRYLS